MIIAMQEVAEMIQKKNLRDTVLSYNLINRQQFLKGAWDRKQIMEKLLNRLEGLPPKKIPFIFPKLGYDSHKSTTCFELLISKR